MKITKDRVELVSMFTVYRMEALAKLGLVSNQYQAKIMPEAKRKIKKEIKKGFTPEPDEVIIAVIGLMEHLGEKMAHDIAAGFNLAAAETKGKEN